MIFSRNRVTIVGVLNATSDSFSDGGRMLRDRFGLPALLGPPRTGLVGTLTGDPAACRDRATAAASALRGVGKEGLA